MAICSKCGKEFNISNARRVIGRIYGAGLYNNYYPNGDMCEDCTIYDISGDSSTDDDTEELTETSLRKNY